MNIQVFLSTLYSMALILPAYGIGKAFLRARAEHEKYAHSDREEKRINEKYRVERQELANRRDQALGDGSWGQKSDDLIAEEQALEGKIEREMNSHGVDLITYARFNETLYEIVRNHPKNNYFLRVNEVIFVGSGIVLGTLASIWSLWI